MKKLSLRLKANQYLYAGDFNTAPTVLRRIFMTIFHPHSGEGYSKKAPDHCHTTSARYLEQHGCLTDGIVLLGSHVMRGTNQRVKSVAHTLVINRQGKVVADSDQDRTGKAGLGLNLSQGCYHYEVAGVAHQYDMLGVVTFKELIRVYAV